MYWSKTVMSQLSITATQLPRFLKCSGSIYLECDTPLPKENKVRDEGNAAHWLVEQVVQHNQPVEELIDRQAPNGIYIDGDMVNYLQPYLQECQGAEIEKDVSFEIAGVMIRARADCVKNVSGTTTIADLKYGWRIIDPDNWTMKAYALGATDRSVGDVILKIYQPRPYHKDGYVRSVNLTNDDMIDLFDELEHNLIEAQSNRSLRTGSHCYGCDKMYACPAAREAGYNIVDMSTSVYKDNLPDDVLSITLDQLNRAADHVKNLLDAYKDEAFARIKKGKVINNYFAERTSSRLDWKKNTSPEFLKMVTGNKDVVKEVLITPTQAKKIGIDEQLVESFSERKDTGLKLIRQDAHKRASKLLNRR